jgi:hypothetical protein
MRISFVGISLLIVLCLPLTPLAQTATTAAVSGTVTDAQGARVARATVKLTDVATGIERVATTDSEGRYNFYAVSPGLLEVAVSAAGFKTKVVNNVLAEVSKAASINLTMEVGAIGEVVAVAAGVEAQLQRSDASIGVVFNEERLRRLPNFSRSATSVFTLQPATAPRGLYAGSRQDQGTYLLDGADVTGNIDGFFSFPVPVESIEELRGTVVNANATFGRSAGAQFVLTTKSGDNQFHGSAYLYHQDSALAANSWINNRFGLKRPFLLDNRFGFTFGGPISKERTFLFVNYEGRRNPFSATLTRIVPTESLRAGMLRFRDSGGAVQTLDANAIRNLDPRSIGPNTKVIEYLNLYPQPNNFTQGDGLNTAGFTFVAPIINSTNYSLIRLDHKFTSRWSATAKFTADRQISTDAGQVDLQKRSAAADEASRPRNLVATVIGVLTPHLTNEARFSWFHDRGDFDATTPPSFVGLNAAINLGPIDDLVDVDTQRARRQFGHSNVYQWSDTLTLIKGAHNIQAGGNVQRIRSIIFRNDKVIGSLTDPVADVGTAGGFVSIPAAQRPSFIRPSDVGPYNNLYASLLGIVSQVPVLITRDGDLNLEPLGTGLLTKSTFRTWEFFLSDTWRWKPSLTLTYGLTYNWQEPPVEDSGKQTILSFRDTGEPIDFKQYVRDRRAAAEEGRVYNPDIAYVPIKKSGRSGAFDTDYTNFSPRLSAAWSPFLGDGWLGRIVGDRRTVIRGGYSMVFDRTNAVQSIIVPSLSGGFAQTINLQGPKNAAGQPFRLGVDGPIPLPTAPATVPSPVVPGKPFGETLSFSVDPHIRVPRNHVFDFTIQRELPWNMLLEIGYIGRLARDLYVAGNLNSVPIMQKDPKSGQTFAQAFDAVAVRLRSNGPPSAQPYFENLYGPGTTAALVNSNAGDFIVGNVSSIQQIALDLITAFLGGKGPILTNLQSQDLTVRFSGASSNYHAMIATLHKRYSRGLTFDMNYTLSQYLDQVYIESQGQIDQIQSSFLLDADYGAAAADIRHLFNANGTYDLPFGKGHRLSFGSSTLNRLASGWFMAGIFTAQSGVPLSVFQSSQAFGGGSVFSPNGSAIPIKNLPAGEGLHSGVNGSNGVGVNSDPSRRGSGLNLFANPEAVYNNFRPVLLSQDGRTGRGVLRGLPRWNLDWTVGKQTNITEKVKFTLSFDFANVFNHVIFANPSLNLQNPAGFGVIKDQFNGPRRIQVGGRIDF